MKKLKIGIDIDNVIADSYPQYIREFNKTFNTSVKYEEIFDFYYLENHAGIEKSRVDLFISDTLHSEEFQFSLPPNSSAQKTIKKWSKAGHSIHYITARPKTLENITRKWLKEHGFWTIATTLDLCGIDTHQKDSVTKKLVVDKLGIHIMIEDAKEVAEVLDTPTFLLDRPWNQGKLPKNVKRVKDWGEIDKIVSRFIKLQL